METGDNTVLGGVDEDAAVEHVGPDVVPDDGHIDLEEEEDDAMWVSLESKDGEVDLGGVGGGVKFTRSIGEGKVVRKDDEVFVRADVLHLLRNVGGVLCFGGSPLGALVSTFLKPEDMDLPSPQTVEGPEGYAWEKLGLLEGTVKLEEELVEEREDVVGQEVFSPYRVLVNSVYQAAWTVGGAFEGAKVLRGGAREHGLVECRVGVSEKGLVLSVLVTEEDVHHNLKVITSPASSPKVTVGYSSI